MTNRTQAVVDVADDDEQDDDTPASGVMESLTRLDRDLKAAATTLTTREARYLVSLYYDIQEQRIRAAAQFRASQQQAEPNALIGWMQTNYRTLESDIKRAMDAYTDAQPLGRWAKSLVGIGPVLAGGLLAHVDVERSTSVSHLWSFAGYNPTSQWDKGQKRPWNAALKQVAWKCGQSFTITSTRKGSFYGPLFAARKAQEQERNEAGAFAEQAAAILRDKRIGEDTDAYAAYRQGKLPPAHLQARAERWTVKLFLSHYWEVAYRLRYQKDPPRPWVLEFGGHVDLIPVPNLALVWPATAG
ncbi:MAG TPA: hypothetical protein VMV29_23460 [Ktedonobacterales bacterium]|nr:hypothetical protein [Ktedonobacterales bacterium]